MSGAASDLSGGVETRAVDDVFQSTGCMETADGTEETEDTAESILPVRVANAELRAST